MSHYFLNLPQGKDRAAKFLSSDATLQNGTYAEILNKFESVQYVSSHLIPNIMIFCWSRTITYNLARALPFSQDTSLSNLIGLRPEQLVGNWRDSNEGLGFGFYPFDVNVALVPASLRATQALLNAGIISDTDIEMNATEVGRLADVWEQHAPGLFEVTLDADRAESRLRDFTHLANPSEALLTRPGSQNPSTVANAAGGDFTYYALSLKQDGTSIEVLNSDIGFNLMYGSNISQDFLQKVIDALQPYPRGALSGLSGYSYSNDNLGLTPGLLTNVGMVVANPAYSSNRTMIEVLNRAAYHGTVVWRVNLEMRISRT